MNKKILNHFNIILAFILIVTVEISAQNNKDLATNNPSQIHLLSHQVDGGVLLRWGPSNYITWKEAIDSGVLLQRAVVPSTEEGFNSYDYDPAFTKVIKPFEKDDIQWEKLVDEDQYAAAAWVALYEEKPQVTGRLPEMIKSQDDINQKSFFVGMLSADHSHQAAIAIGLGYKDQNTKTGESYIYKISLVSDSTIYDRVFVDCTQIATKEVALPPRAESKDKAVQLSWSKEFDGGNFTSYQLERSATPTGPFSRLTNTPILKISSNPGSTEEAYAYYTDSLDVNYKPYYYRIIGINPFGIESQPSPVVSAMGKDFTPPQEVSNIKIQKEAEGVKISWTKDIREPDLMGYIIARSEDPNGPFGPLHEGTITADKKEFIDINVNIRANNYYTVSVIDTAGNSYQSLPKYAVIEDNSPPPTPIGLRGSIDKDGITTLQWEAINDPNIIGYKVYSSNSPDHTFIMKSGELIKEPKFSEKIALKTLSEKIIYKVASVDKGFGYSYLSEALELNRPDIIPPTSGVFKSYQITDDGVQLNWAASNSTDLVSQQLWRKDGNNDWKMIISLDVNEENYLDKSINPNIEYLYALKSVDDAELTSEFSPFLGISFTATEEIAPIENLIATYDNNQNAIILKWDYTDAESYDYLVYRGTGPSNITAYGKSKNEVEFKDAVVKTGKNYTYGIRVIRKDGKESTLVTSEPIQVK